MAHHTGHVGPRTLRNGDGRGFEHQARHQLHRARTDHLQQHQHQPHRFQPGQPGQQQQLRTLNRRHQPSAVLTAPPPAALRREPRRHWGERQALTPRQLPALPGHRARYAGGQRRSGDARDGQFPRCFRCGKRGHHRTSDCKLFGPPSRPQNNRTYLRNVRRQWREPDVTDVSTTMTSPPPTSTTSPFVVPLTRARHAEGQARWTASTRTEPKAAQLTTSLDAEALFHAASPHSQTCVVVCGAKSLPWLECTGATPTQ